jgi:plastocyanin
MKFVVGLSVLCAACGSETTGPRTVTDVGVDGVEDTMEPEDTAVTDTGAPADGGTVAATIHSGSYYFKPSMVTVKVGDTVEWIWDGGTHSVTSGSSCTPDGKFDSGSKSSPYTFRRTFTEAGTYPYFCKYMSHCSSGQVGTITVMP